MADDSAAGRATLTRLTVSNYRSIGEGTSIDFEPLTVLVGINGSGKSNLLDAPQFVADALTDGLENAVERRGGFDSLLRDVGTESGPLRVGLAIEHGDWNAEYMIELSSRSRERNEFAVLNEHLFVHDKVAGKNKFLIKDGQGDVTSTWSGLDAPVRDQRNLVLLAVGGDKRLEPVVSALQAIETYSLSPDALRALRTPSQRAYLSKLGDNWPSILNEVMDGDAASDLRLSLERITGDIVDMKVERLGGYLLPMFGHARSDDEVKWFEAARESDGTLRVAGILTALVQEPPLLMVGIEGPEQTVHAGVLSVLADFLDEASLRSRVVVTTHSPDFLDLIPASAIRVVNRVDGTTRVGRLDEGQHELVRRQLESPGGLLRSQGLLAEEG